MGNNFFCCIITAKKITEFVLTPEEYHHVESMAVSLWNQFVVCVKTPRGRL